MTNFPFQLFNCGLFSVSLLSTIWREVGCKYPTIEGKTLLVCLCVLLFNDPSDRPPLRYFYMDLPIQKYLDTGELWVHCPDLNIVAYLASLVQICLQG